MINAYPQNNMYGNAWWGVVPPYGNTGMGGVPSTTSTQMTVATNVTQDNGLPTIHRVVWGQGMEAAKSVQLNPNETVMILDSESDHFYIAKAGADGKPKPLESFSYTRDESVSGTNADFVTRKEFDELKASLDALRGTQSAEVKEGE